MLSLNRLFYTPYRTPFHTPYRTPYPLLLPCIRLHITIFKSVKFQLILGFACTWFHPIIFTFENSNLSFCAKESAFRFGMSVFFFYYIFLCKNITKDIGRTNVGEMDLSSATKKTLTTIRYGRYVAKLDDMTWSVFCLRILGKYPKFVIHCTFYRTLYRV